ncbi:prepilin-type N-terminal cleavage/methylation domain-containing protein, partial [bacterium]|nr:prepilin-type N-terminal cleavage/methylation domain-containing protein [bacterium]
MREILSLFSQDSANTLEQGFTLLEALVSLSLTSVIMAISVGHVFMLHDGYHNDMARTQINGNLRSALDVMSMNIRQAGENLQSSFPAVILENGASGAPDVLKLRRSRILDVLALCENVSTGATSLPISRDNNSVSGCVTDNVTSTYDAFEAIRTADGGTTRIFLFDLTTRQGEF